MYYSKTPIPEALQQCLFLIKSDALYKQYLRELSNKISIISTEIYQNILEHFDLTGEIVIVICGSMAHNNLSLSSDIDYFIIISNKDDENYIIQIHELIEKSLVFLSCENVLTHTEINQNYILYDQIDRVFLENEVFRNSLISGLLYCSDEFKKELEKKRALLKKQVSQRTVRELFPHYSEKIQNHWNLADSEGRIYLPSLVWKVRMIYLLYDLKNLGEEQLHIDFPEIIHIKTLFHKFRDYLYISYGKKPCMILEKSLDKYEQIINAKELVKKFNEYNDYLNNFLLKNHFQFL